MSYEAWGDGDDGSMNGVVTEERCEEAFIEGARACREMMARFVEQGGDSMAAMSIRANWHPDWGTDPGRPARVATCCWDAESVDRYESAPPSGEQGTYEPFNASGTMLPPSPEMLDETSECSHGVGFDEDCEDCEMDEGNQGEAAENG
jgi:hypothetical protein